mmetsp:Transcript_71881/g.187402  ORF Transcript_71881/g.187402 Transcript_71881/m.187402 type:complete len:435 (+) Transcript_71881:119-1423(+)
MVRGAQAAVYDEYLEDRMRVVLEALVESLLVHKPDDVEKFSMDFLVQWHKDHDPEQEEVQKLRAERDAVLRRRDAAKKELEELGMDPEVGELGEQDEDEEEAAEMEKIRSAQNRRRRSGVMSQSIDAQSLSDYQKPVFEKSEEDVVKIKTALKESKQMQVICGQLDAGPLQDVVNAFHTKEFAQGAEVIKQGDDGDCLYIMKQGSVDIFVARPGPDGEVPKGERGSKVLTLGEGGLFGELALMYSAPRAATVVAAEAVATWVLDAMDFKMLVAVSGAAQYAKYEGWLAGIDLLRPLNHIELATLADALEPEVFDPDEEIIKQGEPGDCFYILEDGSAAAFMSGDFGEKEVKAYSQVGDYFGEIALLSNAPRAASVRATGEGCSVVKLSMEDFTALLGPISEILRENIGQYPHYAEFLSEDDCQQLKQEHADENS